MLERQTVQNKERSVPHDVRETEVLLAAIRTFCDAMEAETAGGSRWMRVKALVLVTRERHLITDQVECLKRRELFSTGKTRLQYRMLRCAAEMVQARLCRLSVTLSE